MTCELGKWSSKGKYHFHKKKDETFFITRGQLLLDLKNKSMILNPGDKFRIKPGQVHRFISLTPLCRFIEVSTQHKNKDSYYE